MNSKLSIKDIILLHHKTYPLMEEIDYIKLIYQSSYGLNHMINSSSKEYLKKEYELFHKSKDNEFIDIGNDMVRLSLINTSLDVDTIYNLLIYTKEHINPDSSLFEEGILSLYSLIDNKALNIKREKVQEILVENNYFKNCSPSHSEKYHKEYDPHYRIVSKERLLELINK